ncbi:MAG: cytochrome c, partial [gamma proteobacterium symbiont of Ctena orbiculata]
MDSLLSKQDCHEIVPALLVTFLLPIFLYAGSAYAEAVDELYLKFCAECHGADRLGGQGPALLPENLHRLRPAKAHKTIAEGRPATQMPPFKERLSDSQIETLVKHIYTPLDDIPQWG